MAKWKTYVIHAPRGVKVKVVCKQMKVQKTKATIGQMRVGFRPICEHGIETEREG
ncbi:MAG TPA: hypothetical protein VF960_06050 [Chloroflexota bacterium]